MWAILRSNGRTDVFNVENGTSWVASSETISFHGAKKGWKKYVDAQRLEVSCGEAPYLVSRYDTITGEKIPLHQRIGLLDRKMRIVQENAETPVKTLQNQCREKYNRKLPIGYFCALFGREVKCS